MTPRSVVDPHWYCTIWVQNRTKFFLTQMNQYMILQCHNASGWNCFIFILALWLWPWYWIEYSDRCHSWDRTFFNQKPNYHNLFSVWTSTANTFKGFSRFQILSIFFSFLCFPSYPWRQQALIALVNGCSVRWSTTTKAVTMISEFSKSKIVRSYILHAPTTYDAKKQL